MILQIVRFNKKPVPKGFKKFEDLEYEGIKYTLWRKETNDEEEIKALLWAGATEIKVQCKERGETWALTKEELENVN